MSNVCNADADMRRRTSATLVSKNLIFVDEAEVPDVAQKGELAQPFETENLLQLTSCGPVGIREIHGRESSIHSWSFLVLCSFGV